MPGPSLGKSGRGAKRFSTHREREERGRGGEGGERERRIQTDTHIHTKKCRLRVIKFIRERDHKDLDPCVTGTRVATMSASSY